MAISEAVTMAIQLPSETREESNGTYRAQYIGRFGLHRREINRSDCYRANNLDTKYLRYIDNRLCRGYKQRGSLKATR